MFETEKEKVIYDLKNNFWVTSKQCALLFGISTRSWLRVAESNKITTNKDSKIHKFRANEVLAYFVAQYGEI